MQYGSIFIRLAVVASEICEITRKSEKIRTCNSSRSSTVINLGANRKRIWNFLLVINSNFGRSLPPIPFSRYWRLQKIQIENGSFNPPLPCLTLPLRGIPLEFLDETYPAKTRGMELLYGVNCIILTSTVFDWSTRVTDGQTDWRAIAYSPLCIYAVAR